MNDEACVPLAEIVNGLNAVCVARQTGTMYITTDSKKSAQVMINEGVIVYLYFYNKRGMEALRLMAEMEFGRFKFQEGLPTSLKADLPTTNEILKQLEGAVAKEPVIANDVVSADMPAEKPAGGKSGTGLNTDQKQLLEDALTDYIGPMAAFVCEDHLGTARDVESAVNALAAEIPEPNKAAKFKEQMVKSLAS